MTAKESYNIKTDRDLNQVLEEIDEELRSEGVEITARQLKGWLRFSSRFGLHLKMSDPLSQTVMAWFEARYGDRLKLDNQLGELPVVIRGDLYKLTVPIFFGRVEFICDPRFWRPNKGMQIAVTPSDPLPRVNLLNCISGMTESFALTLTDEEQRSIGLQFKDALGHFVALDTIANGLLIVQAKGDINASVRHLFERPPQYGLSKWAALQAVEKFLKGFIAAKGGNFPHSHNLQTLATQAETLGLTAIPAHELSKVQCTAAVRYGGIVVTASESVDVYHTAVRICGRIAKEI